MLIRIVRMTFREDALDQFLNHFQKYKKLIRAFEGCSHLELWQDVHQPNICNTYSIWKDEQALNQYRESELFKAVWAATKPLFKEKPMAFSSKKIEELP